MLRPSRHGHARQLAVAILAAVGAGSAACGLLAPLDGHETSIGADASTADVQTDVRPNEDAGGDADAGCIPGAGAPDPAFGDAGIAQVATSVASVESVAIDAQDRIVITGYGGTPAVGTMIVVARLLANGAIDPSFGPAGDGVVRLSPRAFRNEAHVVRIDGQGRVVVGGEARSPAGDADFLLLRLEADGGVDRSFGGSDAGFAVFDYPGTGGNDRLIDLTILPSGMVVAGGSVTAEGSSRASFAVARFSAEGMLDPTFGPPDGGGIVATAINSGSAGTGDSVAKLLVSGNQILATGSSNVTTGGTDTKVAIVAYQPSGALDVSFPAGTGGANGGGIRQLDLGASSKAWGAVRQSNDDVVIVGERNQGAGTAASAFARRIVATGADDPSFTVDAIGRVGGVSIWNASYAVLVQSGDRLLVTGAAFDPGPGFGPSQGRAIVARLTRDGARDRCFGDDGVTVFPEGTGSAQAAALTRDGANVVVAGPGPSGIFVARVHAP